MLPDTLPMCQVQLAKQVLPLEIWKEISLLLPYNHLSLSTSLSKIYSEDWFEKKVKSQYPNISNKNYQTLYKRFLQSGQIYEYDCKKLRAIDMEGVKALNCNFAFVLTFDGKLYTHDKILIDTDVTDANGLTYIKNTKWYRRSNNNRIKSKLIAEDKFISCAYHLRYHFAITSNKIYKYNNDDKELAIIPFDNQVKIINNNGLILIQTEDGSLYKYRTGKISKLNIGPIEKLFNGAAKLKNGLIVTFRYEYDRFNKDFVVKILTTPSNNLQGSMYYCNRQFLLIDNKVYKLNERRELKLIQENVKYIGNGYLIM